MSWIPKPGDKVTSPLLVGEWQVTCATHHNGLNAVLTITGERGVLTVPAHYVSPVVPPLPPEPPVGEVVWVRGEFWHHDVSGMRWWHQDAHCEEVADWSDIAADAVPVVPITKVANWLRDEYGYDGLAAAAIAEFGWDKP